MFDRLLGRRWSTLPTAADVVTSRLSGTVTSADGDCAIVHLNPAPTETLEGSRATSDQSRRRQSVALIDESKFDRF